MAAATAFIAAPASYLRGASAPATRNAAPLQAMPASMYVEGAAPAMSSLQLVASFATAAVCIGAARKSKGARRQRKAYVATAASTTTTTTTVTTTETTVVEGGSGGPNKLNIAVIGYGNVGKEFVRQLTANREKLRAELGTDVEVVALARSTQMVLTPSGSFSMEKSGGKWPEGETHVFKDLLQKTSNERSKAMEGDVVPLSTIGDHLVKVSQDGDKGLIVDCTHSNKVVDLYKGFLEQGVHVVSLNTGYGTGSYKRFEEIMAAAKQTNSSFKYEETLGAGLNIVNQLQGLVRAGDKVNTIKVFSDTPSYVFKNWAPGKKFSDVVAEARKLGQDGGDPKNYLSCRDLRRSLNILARAIGVKMTTSFVKTEFLLPDQLWSFQAPPGGSSADAFMKELSKYDAQIDAVLEAAAKDGKVLRFVGTLDVASGKASIKVEKFPKNSIYGYNTFPNNLYEIHTDYHADQPLIVENRRTGNALRAAGVFDEMVVAMREMKN